MALKNIPVPPSKVRPDYKQRAGRTLPRTAVTGPGLPPGATPTPGIPANATPNPGIPANATPNAKVPRNATPSVGIPANAGKLMGGNTKLSPASLKGRALLHGRPSNLKSKQDFKSGPHARTQKS